MSTRDHTPAQEPCQNEAIFAPGCIQPHGVLLGLDEELTVRVASANAVQHLGAGPEGGGTLLGTNLTDLLGKDGPELNTLLRTARGGLTLRIGGRDFYGQAHTDGGLALLELEPRPAGELEEKPLLASLNAHLTTMQNARDTESLLRVAADALQQLSGFDRVTTHRFNPDWDSEVVMECLHPQSPDQTSRMGLHYPAADFPAHARMSPPQGGMRLIADVHAPPVALEPDRNPLNGQPLSLSLALLRNVSTSQQEYLRGKGVTASMSLLLVVQGRVWGLMACHHHQGPRAVSQPVRQACSLVAQTLAPFIGAVQSRQSMEYRAGKDAILARLTEHLRQEIGLDQALLAAEPNMLDLVDASGAAIMLGDNIWQAGATPDKPWIRHLARWLFKAMPGPVLAVDDLSTRYQPAQELSTPVCGLAAVHLDETGDNLLLWFRPETARIVNWAGTPPQAPVWRQVLRGASRPWTESELYALERLRVVAADALVRQTTRELVRVNRELVRKNQEIDSFASMVSHDLREPLRGLMLHAQDLMEMSGNRLEPAERHKLDRIVALSRRMRSLLDSLLKYSVSATRELELAETDLCPLLEECLELLQESIQSNGANVSILPGLPVVYCDAATVRELYLNLLSNALKFADGPPRIEIGARAPESPLGPPVLYVRDHGIGLEPSRVKEAFTMFRRLHGRTEYGGGTGAGLALVRKIVERHKGLIRVEPTPGGGTTFVFTLAQAPR